jgi:rfaE bifunctional protein nucleotidyltransferase chain/domain
MSGSKLVVFGDTLLDCDVEGAVERLSPDAAVPVVDLDARRWRPGGAGLAALLAGRAGHQVVLVTALGADDSARRLADLLGEHTEVVAMPLRGATVCKTRILTGGQSLLRVDSGDGRAAGPPAAHRLRSASRGAAAVLVADYGRGVSTEPAVRAVLSELADRLPVVWDPHPRGARPVPACRLATPNKPEALRAVPEAGGVGAAAAALRGRWRCAAVAVTCGADGAVVDTGQGRTALPAPHPSLPAGADTCGAGDAFAAAATGALIATNSVTGAVRAAIDTASRFVADGAAAAVDVAPAATPRSELSAAQVAARVRRRGGRLVATGGCFDLLHAGHLSLLRRARALGDALVVCVNSDASVRRRKGAGRPLVRATDRMALLAALEPVDAVAVFDEDTPAALLETLRPDVWVKGGDYTARDLPEAEVISRHGGEVVIVPSVDGYSTSGIVAAARGRVGLPGIRRKEKG